MKSKFRRKVKEEWQGRRIYPPIVETQGWAIKRTSEDGFSWFVAAPQFTTCNLLLTDPGYMAELVFSFKYEAEYYKKFNMKRCSDMKDKVVRVVVKEV